MIGLADQSAHIHGAPVRADKARGNIARLSRAFSARVGKTGTKQGAVGFLQKVREQLADHLFAGKAGGNQPVIADGGDLFARIR